MASTKRDYYEILGVTRLSNASEIKAAYKRRAKETHPDAGGSASAFAQVREAYRVLSSPLDRRSYDRSRIRQQSERYWYAQGPPPASRTTKSDGQGWPGYGSASVSGDEDRIDRLLDVVVKVGRPIFWVSQKIGDVIEALLGDPDRVRR